MSNLKEELSLLFNPTPTFHDPEDDIEDVTLAKLTSKEKSEDVVEEGQSTKLRKKTALLLSDFDDKYTGKKVSRSKLSRSSGGNEIPITKQKATKSLHRMIDDSESDGVNDAVYDEYGMLKDDSEEDDTEEFKSALKKKAKASADSSFSFVDDGDYGKYADDESNEDEEGEEDDEYQSEASDDEEGDNSDDAVLSEGDNEDDSKDDSEREQTTDKPSDNLDKSSDGMKNFSESDRKEQMKKGKAVKNQLGLWDSLLEGRIKMQKVSVVVNQLPLPDKWSSFTDDEEVNKATKEAQNSLKNLMDKLTELQDYLLDGFPETKHLVDISKAPQTKPALADDDEEITSESEVDSDKEDKPKTPSIKPVKRKISWDDYPEFLAKRHKNFRVYRNNTIQKWYDKTKLTSGKISKSFSAFEQSAVKLIDQILSDKARLVKRTQLKRSAYQILGCEEQEQSTIQSETEDKNEEKNNYNTEIFDDDDFYHQLLRQLIEKKTSDISDPIALSRQWLEIQKIRKKVKRKVDTRASKGRKIRYEVHKKLLNFMAQEDRCTWTDESRNDLFKSLFGKRFGTATDVEVFR